MYGFFYLRIISLGWSKDTSAPARVYGDYRCTRLAGGQRKGEEGENSEVDGKRRRERAKRVEVGEEAKSQKTEGKTEGQREYDESTTREEEEKERVETERVALLQRRANGLCLQGCSFDSHVAVVS